MSTHRGTPEPLWGDEIGPCDPVSLLDLVLSREGALAPDTVGASEEADPGEDPEHSYSAHLRGCRSCQAEARRLCAVVLLGGALNLEGAEETQWHPPRSMLLAQCGGLLEQERSVLVSEHLASCPACQQQVQHLERRVVDSTAALQRFLTREGGPVVLRGPRQWFQCSGAEERLVAGAELEVPWEELYVTATELAKQGPLAVSYCLGGFDEHGTWTGLDPSSSRAEFVIWLTCSPMAGRPSRLGAVRLIGLDGREIPVIPLVSAEDEPGFWGALVRLSEPRGFTLVVDEPACRIEVRLEAEETP